MNLGQKLTVIAAVLILTLTSPAVFAQGDADTWEFSLAPYLWAVGLDGDITVKGTTQSVDVDFDELLDEVDYAVQLHFEAKKGDWSLIVDPTIIKVDSGQKMGPSVDASRFGRKEKAAKGMTELHEEFAQEGWTVIGVAVYTENQDLEGFFVTYVKE